MTALALWPDENQVLLLHAALASDDKAQSAFNSWRRRVDIRGPLDRGSYRLLPLLHHNLTRLGCQDPLMQPLQRIRRQAWFDTQNHVRRGASVIALLNDHGIATMVSKGLALALHYYDSPGLRPMSDIDVVVPITSVIKAVSILEAAGWRIKYEVEQSRWEIDRDDVLLRESAMSLCDGSGGEIDVHWHLFHEGISRAADRRFWGSATPLSIAGIPTLRTSAADLLLHVTMHGLRRNEVPPFRWIADAVMILRRDSHAINWNDLLSFARRQHMGHRLHLGLDFIRREFGCSQLPVCICGNRQPDLIEWLEAHVARGMVKVPLSTQTRLAMAISRFARFTFSDRSSDVPRLTLKWLKQRITSHSPGFTSTHSDH